jgi:hypothetical protein
MLTDDEIQKLHNSALHDRRPQMVSAEVICQLCNSYGSVPSLIHQRDEARELHVNAYEIVQAEARGFERGIREAAKVCDQCPDSHWGPWIRKRILALLEPVTLQEPEA